MQMHKKMTRKVKSKWRCIHKLNWAAIRESWHSWKVPSILIQT